MRDHPTLEPGQTGADLGVVEQTDTRVRVLMRPSGGFAHLLVWLDKADLAPQLAAKTPLRTDATLRTAPDDGAIELANDMPVRVLGSTSVVPAGADAVSAATALIRPQGYEVYDLLMGNIPGTIGEVCKIAILIGFLYMLFVGTIKWHIPVIFVGTVALFTWLIGGDLLKAVLSGGLLFGAVFMATDYVTNPMLRIGQVIFAVGCGVLVSVIRMSGSYPEGVTYAILLMNILTPLIDRLTSRRVYGTVKQHA